MSLVTKVRSHFGQRQSRGLSRGHGAVFVPSDVSIWARWSLPE
jgi:hypothetical protein